jgi:hypothetical protein
MAHTNNEDFDFFDDDQYGDSQQSRGNNTRRQRSGGARSASGHGPGRSSGRLTASSPSSTICGRLAVITGLLAVVVSAASAVHEIAPLALSFLTSVPGLHIAVAAAVLIVLTLILAIAARVTMPRYATRTGVGSGGSIASVLAIVCLVVGVAVGVLFPDGIIRSQNDKAPVSDSSQMEQGIEQAAGTCADGWQGLDSGGLPGVTDAELCSDPRMAFVSFESDVSAAIGRAPIESKITELLGQHADDTRAQGDWRLLSGKRWMVFGQADAMTALQQQWGGDLETIAAQDSGQ